MRFYLYLISSIIFIGCGGGGSSSPSIDKDSQTSNIRENIDSSSDIEEDRCDSITTTSRWKDDSEMIREEKYKTKGDIIAICNEDRSKYILSLDKSKEYIEVIKLLKEELLTYKSVKETEKQSGSIKDIYNYQKGTVRHKIKTTYQDFDCIDTYPTPLPEDIDDGDDIRDLLDWKGDIYDKISTTCPEAYDIYMNEFYTDIAFDFVSAKQITDYTITESTNKKHSIKKTITLSVKEMED